MEDYTTPTREDGLFTHLHGVKLENLNEDTIQKLICDSFVVLAHRRGTKVTEQIEDCLNGLYDAEAQAALISRKGGEEKDGKIPNAEWGE